jgi:hypothetical protein
MNCLNEGTYQLKIEDFLRWTMRISGLEWVQFISLGHTEGYRHRFRCDLCIGIGLHRPSKT